MGGVYKTSESTERSGSHPQVRGQVTRELFRNRDFVLLWGGQLLSQVGDRCLLIAGITLISSLTSSPLAMLIPAFSIAIPQLVFGLMGGVIADRWNRKHVMIASDILRSLIVLSVLLVNSAQQLWILYLAAAGLAMVGVVFYPTRNAVLPTFVPSDSLMAANSLIQGSYIIALIIGPLIAGVAIELWAPAVILFDSATFLASAVISALMAISKSNPEQSDSSEEKSVWSDMKVGLNFIRYSQVLRRVLMITAVATLGFGSVILLAIPHLKSKLGAGGLEYGIAMSVLGIGAVVGGLVVNRLSLRFSTSTIVGAMLTLAGAAIIAFAYAPSYIVVLISVVVTGMCIVIARGALNAVTQAIAPDEIRGRVLSAVNIIVVASTAISEGVAAVIGSVIGVQTVFVAAGFVTGLTGFVAILALRDAAHMVRPVMGEAV